MTYPEVAPAAASTATPPATGPDNERPTMGRTTSTTKQATIQTPHRSLRNRLPPLRAPHHPRATLEHRPHRGTRQLRPRMGHQQPPTSTLILQPTRRPRT